MLVINKKLIFFFTLTFVLLQSLGFALPGNIFIAFFMPITVIFLLVNLFSDKYFLFNIINLCKYTPFIYILLFYMWSIVTIIVSIVNGFFNFGGFLTGFVGGLTFSFMFVFITMYIFLKENYTDLKGFIKFLILFYIFVMIIGLINYVDNICDIDLIKKFLILFNNKRIIFFNLDTHSIENVSRVKSIFDEPGNLGAFIYSQLPIMYAVSLSKYKLFDNIFLNKFVKIILLPLTFINLVLTKSPISLIFVFLVTIIYFYKNIIKYVKKYFSQIITILLISSIILIIIYNNINLEKTYLQRIIVTVPNLFHLNTLIIVEPSLATRIINYIIMLQEGAKNILFGIGYGTITKHFSILLQNTNLPLTLELETKLSMGGGNPAAAIFYRVFCETGLIGLILLLTFYFRTILKFYKIKLPQENIEKDFCYGLFISLLAQSTFILFYDSNLHNTYNVILYAIAVYLTSDVKYISLNKVHKYGYFNNTCKL